LSVTHKSLFYWRLGQQTESQLGWNYANFMGRNPVLGFFLVGEL
jgi:hypothetical protein